MSAENLPRSRWWASAASTKTMVVHESTDAKSTWSGLYDADGRKLMRPPEPIGFVALRERN